jgi:hypothetical protein
MAADAAKKKDRKMTQTELMHLNDKVKEIL